MDLNHLPIIDWELGIKLAGNKKDLADDMLSLLLTSLKEEVEKIQHFYNSHDYSSALKNIHKLHGAICYCGVPRLKTVIARLESDLKSNTMDSLQSLFDQLQIEVDLLIRQYESHQS